MSGSWPDEALVEQATFIGPALLHLIDSETRWVHRRVERIELLSATQMTRCVAADLTVPVALQHLLGLHAQPSTRGADASRFVLPLGVLSKAPLQDFTVTPTDVHRLTAEQTTTVVLAALTPYARVSGAAPPEILKLAQRIIRSENAEFDLLQQFEALLDAATHGDGPARERLRNLVEILNEAYILLVAVEAEPGMPMRIAYTHRQIMESRTGEVSDPPLVIELRLPHASGPGPAYRVEVVAPDGLEVETASIVAVEGNARRPVESINTDPGGGAFIQLRAPDAPARPAQASLQVTFGWPKGGIQHVATIAGSASTLALLIATIVSYWLNDKMKGSSAGTLLAAPALVTGLALGFPTTSVTSTTVNRLRLATLFVALIGVTGALTVSLLGENATKLNTLHGVLIACTIVSALVTAAFPLQAMLRPREQVQLADAS